MVINICKHSRDFMLGYDASIGNYAYVCVDCSVFKLSFNPQLAGKIGRTKESYFRREEDDVFVAVWTDKLVAYTRDKLVERKRVESAPGRSDLTIVMLSKKDDA